MIGKLDKPSAMKSMKNKEKTIKNSSVKLWAYNENRGDYSRILR